MRVRSLLLEDFRSYARTARDIAPGVTALVGSNGAGKTNVLEAIHLIARGDSPRARDDSELVRWGSNTARVSAHVERVDDARTVDIVLFAPPDGERRRPRRYLLDGAGKRADEAVGELAVVSFFPEDVQLLAEAPSARRRYLDAMVGQVHKRHRAESREYMRVLGQRNALLRVLRDEGISERFHEEDAVACFAPRVPFLKSRQSVCRRCQCRRDLAASWHHPQADGFLMEATDSFLCPFANMRSMRCCFQRHPAQPVRAQKLTVARRLEGPLALLNNDSLLLA